MAVRSSVRRAYGDDGDPFEVVRLVTVINYNRVTEVLVSEHDYDDYQRLKAMGTRALWVHELSGETLGTPATARVDPRHDELDSLMGD